MLGINPVKHHRAICHENKTPDRGSVLILADCQDDAAMVKELLNGCRLHGEWSDFLPYSGNNHPKLAANNNHYVATVLCYRSKKREKFEILPIKQLPGQRIIVLSDCGAESTVISLLSEGAHHLFDVSESAHVLQVRIEAALRNQVNHIRRSFWVRDYYFDVAKRQVIIQGLSVNLSPKEYDLAEYLFLNLGRIVTHTELLSSIWSLPLGTDTRRIDTAVCQIRKKLGLGAEDGWELKKLRSVGYRLVTTTCRSKYTY